MVSRILRGLAALAIIAAMIGATPRLGYAAPPKPGAPTFQVDDLPFKVQPDRLYGLPGDKITVSFYDSEWKDNYLIQGCRVWFAPVEDSPVPESAAQCSRIKTSELDWDVTVVVPERYPEGVAYLHWTLSYSESRCCVLNFVAPKAVDPPAVWPSVPGHEPFTIFSVDVTATPTATDPGKLITVDFTALTGVPTITDCSVTFADRTTECPSAREPHKSVRIRVPTDLVEAEPVPLSWHFTYVGWKDQETGDGYGTIPITVSIPPPKFDVRPESQTAQPGVPFTVTFTSLTRGIDITGCGIALKLRAECSRSGIAVLIVPPDTPPRTTLPISWDLAYVSSRPGEPPGTRKGTLTIPVEVTEPSFAVTVQPASAAPGEEITLSYQSLVDGVHIVDCIAFFPNAAAGYCQRTPEQWVTRTTVPKDAQPGALLLRWGVESRTAGGAPGEVNDVIAYPVVARSTTPPTKPSSSPAGQMGTGPPDHLQPTFVAMTDPASAAPGKRVTVTISPVDPTAHVTGCVVAFGSHGGTACREAGGRWSASIRVPDSAEPDTDVLLSWSATSRTASGKTGAGSGTVSYRVLEPGAPPPATFKVGTDPTAAAAGQRVAVSHESLVPGVIITACQAGFADGAMTICHQVADHWVADITVPAATPPGSYPIRWRLAYSRAGQAPASTNGLVSFRVTPGSPHRTDGIWDKLWPYIWRILLGGVLLVGLVGGRRLAGRIRHWRGQQRSDATNTDLPSFRVLPVLSLAPPAVTVNGADTPARHRVRLVFRRPPPLVRLQE